MLIFVTCLIDIVTFLHFLCGILDNQMRQSLQKLNIFVRSQVSILFTTLVLNHSVPLDVAIRRYCFILRGHNPRGLGTTGLND